METKDKVKLLEIYNRKVFSEKILLEIIHIAVNEKLTKLNKRMDGMEKNFNKLQDTIIALERYVKCF